MNNFKKYYLRLQRATVTEIVSRITIAIENKSFRAKIEKGQFKVHLPLSLGRSERIRTLQPPLIHYDDNREKRVDNNESDLETFETKCRNRFTYDISPEEDDPDIRSVWEPARLQHITTLLFKLTSSPDSPDKEKEIRKSLYRWIEANPLLRGPHYISAMECGLRLPVFFYSLKILQNLTESEQEKLLTSIYQHGWWISKRLSLHSSLGNHTICEAVGLIFAGAVFQDDLEAQQWLSTGISLLRQELEHQIVDDGGPVEQSLSYHRFVLDLYWLALDFLRNNDLADCDDWFQRLSLGEAFISVFNKYGTSFPLIGDSDDGCAVAPGLYPEKHCGNDQHLDCPQKTEPLTKFPTSGYSVLRQDDFFLSFDHGPLGMPPLFNHGHADALAITLSYKKTPFLVDPGTFRYNGVPEWRRYFKSTRAHNTVCIDSEDQAVQETGFIWSKPYQTTLDFGRRIMEDYFLKAHHDGYTRLRNPVTHFRSLLWQDGGCLIVKDTFQGKGEHVFELNFHFHPDVVLTKEGDRWVVENNRLQLIIVSDQLFSHIRGKEKPILGWYSEAYGVKEPTSVLSCQVTGEAGGVEFVTMISIDDRDLERGKIDFEAVEQQITHP